MTTFEYVVAIGCLIQLILFWGVVHHKNILNAIEERNKKLIKQLLYVRNRQAGNVNE